MMYIAYPTVLVMLGGPVVPIPGQILVPHVCQTTKLVWLVTSTKQQVLLVQPVPLEVLQMAVIIVRLDGILKQEEDVEMQHINSVVMAALTIVQPLHTPIAVPVVEDPNQRIHVDTQMVDIVASMVDQAHVHQVEVKVFPATPTIIPALPTIPVHLGQDTSSNVSQISMSMYLVTITTMVSRTVASQIFLV